MALEQHIDYRAPYDTDNNKTKTIIDAHGAER